MLNVETEITTVELALLRALRLAFLKRGTAVADVAALRSAEFAYPSMVPGGSLRYVTAEASLFEWAQDSTATDDGVNVVKPASVTTGRWLRVTEVWQYGANYNALLHSRVVSPWAVEVVLYEGEDDGDSLIGRVGKNVPALLLRWTGDNPKSLLLPGAVYRNEHSFTVLALTRNARTPNLSPEAVTGSPQSEDDPGINTIVGQLRKLLGGLVLCEGCQPLIVGPALPGTVASYGEDGTEGERFFLVALALTLKTSYSVPDDDLVTLDGTDIAPELADQGPDEEAFDGQNYITAGLGVAPGAGLSRTIPAGAVTVAGVSVTTASTSRTFSASVNTYRDVVTATGALVFSEVAIGDPAPDLASGRFRIGVTMTNSADIIDDTFLASVSKAYDFAT